MWESRRRVEEMEMSGNRKAGVGEMMTMVEGTLGKSSQEVEKILFVNKNDDDVDEW